MSSDGSLGDVLAALLAEVHGGRVAADLRAANIARLYAESETLRGFPVPIFRIGEVVLELPLLIQGLASKPDDPVRAFPDRDQLVRASLETLKSLDLSGLGVSMAGDQPEQQRRLSEAMVEEWRLYEEGRLTDEALLSALARRTVDTARDAIKSGARSAARDILPRIAMMLEEALRSRFRNHLSDAAKPAPDSGLRVAISSDAIREAGGAQSGAVTRITVKLFEEAGRWTASGTSPGEDTKLKLVLD